MLAGKTAELRKEEQRSYRGRRVGSRSYILLLAIAVLAPAGCSRLKQQVRESVDNNPQVRQSAVDNARKSCIQTATAKAPKLPGVQQRIDNYCDCFATKGLSKFSNSELASIGFHGGQFSPEQKAKLNEGVQMCISTLREHAAPRSAVPVPAPAR